MKSAAKKAAQSAPLLAHTAIRAFTKSAAAAAATASSALPIASSSSTHANLQQFALPHSSFSSLSKRQSQIATMSASSELLAAGCPERAFTLRAETLRLLAAASLVEPVLEVEEDRPPPLPPPQSAPQGVQQNRVPMAPRTRVRATSDLRDLTLPPPFGSPAVLLQQLLHKKTSTRKPRRNTIAPCPQLMILLHRARRCRTRRC